MAERERGCLKCTNSCVKVPQDKFYAVERFGRFVDVVGPGLSCVGMDCFGCCVTLRSITSRVTQTSMSIVTKTSDNVFVTLKVAVQQAVLEEKVQEAIYKLEDSDKQIEAYVADVVRSQVPRMTLDEVFDKKDEVSAAVKSLLQEEMEDFGLQILEALVTEVEPDSGVMEAMNEINKQKRLREATIAASEADKVRVVKAAEAAADSAQLQGEGIARQRHAIIDGLRDSISSGGGQRGEAISPQRISELLLVTQYFDTMRDIAGGPNSSVVFVPERSGGGGVGGAGGAGGGGGGLAAQMRNAILQASAN